MKNLSIISFAVAVIGACQLVPACNQPIDWPEVAKCSPQVNDLVGTVQRILLSGGQTWKEELEQLARVHGADTVACVTRHIVDDWNEPGSAMTPQRIAAIERGQEFLHDTGTKFE